MLAGDGSREPAPAATAPERRWRGHRNLRMTVAYDGTSYAGWQRQLNGLSVQQVLEEALQPFAGPGARPVVVAGASRTDAGVHAAGQVASARVAFTAPADAVLRGLNVRLPADIRVLDVVDAHPDFHARFDATGKRYRYRISTAPVLSPFDRWFVWHLPYRLNVPAMHQAAAAVVGRHDFRSFQARGATTHDAIRTIERADVIQTDQEIHFIVEGTGFVRHMVRILVGTLLEVGAGRRDAGWLADVVERKDREAAGPTAPAAGLVLESVRY